MNASETILLTEVNGHVLVKLSLLRKNIYNSRPWKTYISIM